MAEYAKPSPQLRRLLAQRRAEKEVERSGLPTTQEEACDLAARVSLAVGPIPKTDEEIIEAAYGSAVGLFGPAFEAASEDLKWTWIDMCERSFRKALNK